MDLKTQLKTVAPVLVMVYAITTATLSLVIFLGMEHRIELDHFTQDPVAIMDQPFYLGLFSHIGILLWCATASVCFYTWRLLSYDHPQRPFLLFSGLVTTLLMVDDLFLLHELVFPDYFHIPKNAVYLIYLNLLLAYAVVFRKELLESENVLLMVSALLIGSSQFVDLLPMPIPEDSFLEDAVKLFGIITWFLYYARYCIAVFQGSAGIRN
jgi:hypothetical protein